ncbi:MAG: histidinol-phosphate transaminase [Acidobacteria bacterium]|nr:histidinol-phosphate transaminase [Acidobacteriota bacterium]
MRPLTAPHVSALRPYSPGRSIEQVKRELGIAEVIKLASNESPFGPSPLAVEAMARALCEAHRYPDDARELREELASRLAVPPERILTGAGATDLIELCVRTFTSPGEHAVVSACSFLAYGLFLRAAAVDVTFAPVRDFAIDLDAIASAVREDTRLIFIPNPNNPTGSSFGAAALDRFVARLPPDVVLVLDDAYVDYHDIKDNPDTLAIVRRRERTVVLRSFSKAHGLAGMRVGYAITTPPLIDALQRVQRPFAVSGVAIAGALAALGDHEHVERVVTQNRIGRAYLTSALRELGLAPLESQTNFVTVPLASEADAADIAEGLLRRGVIIRPLAAFGMPRAVRISVGTKEQNQQAIAALADLLRAHPALHGRPEACGKK